MSQSPTSNGVQDTYGRYSESAKRGCPTCDGVDPKTCMRCFGKTKLRHWFFTDQGFAHMPPEKE